MARRCFVFFASLAFLASWRSDVGAADARKVTYEEHVLPLLRDKCIACHNPDKKRGGLVVTNYTKLMEGSSSGAVVKPGDPDSSPLYKVVAHLQEPFMPPKSPMLPKENAELIRKWIAGGALENAGSKVVKVNKPTIDFTLPKVVKGKPEGPPPMPPRTLGLEPVVRTMRANAITAIAASPWAPLVAVAGQKQVLLYHSDTLELLGVLPFPEGVAHVLKFSRNGSLLLAGGGRGGKSGRVVVWSVTRGERLFAVGDEMDCVLAADISPDQTQIALGGPSKVVRIYSTRDGKLLQEIRKHTDWVTTLEFSPDGVLLATGDRNGGLFVWEAFTAREYFSLRGHTASITEVSWRTDSNVIASGSEDGTVRLWEMENGRQIRSWGAHGGGVQSVRYARDGRIVSCGRDRLTRVWDGNGGAKRSLEVLPDVALRTTFTHDAGRVVAGDWTGQVVVWNSADGKRVGLLSANPPSAKEQLELAIKELAQRRKAAEQVAAGLTAALAQTKAAETNLARLRDVAAKAPGALVRAQQAVPKAKAGLDRARAALAAGRKTQKIVVSLMDAVKKAEAAVVAAQKAVTAATVAVQQAPKDVANATAALKALQPKANAARVTAAEAAKAVAGAEAAVAKWKAAQTVARTPGR